MSAPTRGVGIGSGVGVVGVVGDPGSTPAVIKRRQLGKWFNSPTDSFLSPCSQKLFKPKILPELQQTKVPSLNLDVDDNADGDQNEKMAVDNTEAKN